MATNMNVSYNEKILIINGYSIEFSHEIRQLELVKNKLIVLLSIPQNDNTLDNIYAVTDTADVLWRVESLVVDYLRLPYEQMVIHGDEIRATDFYGRRVFISENTGKILKKDIVK